MTTINLTKVKVNNPRLFIMIFFYPSVAWFFFKGGVQSNVVPSEMVASMTNVFVHYELAVYLASLSAFDVRITPHQSLDDFDKMIKGWMNEISPDIRLEFEQVITERFVVNSLLIFLLCRKA